MIKRAKLAVLAIAALALAVGGIFGPSPAAAQEDKYKVFVSVGFEGNTWMDAAQNLISAMAKTKAYKDRAELNMQSARGDIQTQIQQVNAMMQGDADIIILWPNSRTALNRSIRQACERGIIVMTFDASVTEPCAYHIGLDQTWAGAGPAEYLAEQLGGKGSIIVMGGYPGHYIDHARTDGAMEVFSQYPEISILVHAYSNWNNAHARQELTKIVATHGWDNIDGLWTQVGCYMLSQIQVEAGRADQLVPCAGNGTNGHRIAIAEPGSVPGALGMKSSSMGSPTWLGAYALKIAVAYADGGAEPPRFTQVPMPLVEPGQVVVCTEGTREELLERNCNTYHPDLGVPPNYFVDVWHPWVGELDLFSALEGTVPEGQ